MPGGDVDTTEIERAQESGGSGSSRKYNRDPRGSTTGGQFTAGSSQSSTSQSSAKPVYAPRPKKGGGGGAKEQLTAPSSSKFKTLAPGEDNDGQAVAEMQQLLTALGLGNLTSGTYDKDTENAVREAQRRLGIKPNGKANKALINKMLTAYDLSPCVKRSDGGSVAVEIQRRRSYPGQKYRHGWIPASPLALLSPEDVDDEYGTEIDSVEVGDECRIVARRHGITVESDKGDAIAIHATPSVEDAPRWADAIDDGETFTRPHFSTQPYDGGVTIRFGDYQTDLDEDEAGEVAQGLRDMAYHVEDATTPEEPDMPEIDGDEASIPDDPRRSRSEASSV